MYATKTGEFYSLRTNENVYRRNLNTTFLIPTMSLLGMYVSSKYWQGSCAILWHMYKNTLHWTLFSAGYN